MTRTDLNILQRLSIGFGMLLLLLTGLLGYVFTLHARSSAVQRELVDDIRPRAQRARSVERHVMAVALAGRGVLLSPTAVARSEYNVSVQTLRGDVQGLGSMPMDQDDRAEFAAFEPALERYLQTIGDALSAVPSPASDAALELALSRDRDAAIEAVRRFVDLQNTKEQQVLAHLADRRASIDRGLIVMSVFTLIGFLFMGTGTAESIRRPARELLRIAGALEKGDLGPALVWASTDSKGVRPRSEMTQLARAFGAAGLALERREQRLRASAAVAEAAGRTLDKREMAVETLRSIAAHVGAEAGVVYLHDAAAHRLEPIATHAVNASLAPLHVGEGIPGEAAGQRRTLIVSDIPLDTPLTVKFGYDAAPPRTVVAVPVLFHDKLLAVVVLASLRPLDDQAMAFLEAAAVPFGTGLQNANAHAEVEQLVTDLQQRNETIQAQNEEIQAQAEELQAQNEELQLQNEEIHAQNDQLRERTEQIEERGQQLRQQATLLAEADERKNEFLAKLGHELRNPMAALTMSLRVQDKSGPTGEQARSARMIIERQVHHLNRLIDDLLDLTAISRGKVSIQREPLDFAEVVRSCVEDQRVSFEAKNIALEIELPPEAVWLEGDRTRLCQVVNNLLHNARKFTLEGGRVRVILTATLDDGDATLRIVDDGIGFDPVLGPHLFEPFRQDPTALNRAKDGLGLGLTLVKTFTELHGGSVQARSDGAGKGAQFVIRLPLCATEAGGSPASAPWAGDTQTRRILIVEDNVDVAWSLCQMLMLQGHQVEMAHTVAAALNKARAALPELVLCDIGLPDADGYELAQRFRADERLRSVVLVALTGYASPGDRSRATAAGFDYHFSKPLDLNQFREIVGELHAASSRPAD